MARRLDTASAALLATLEGVEPCDVGGLDELVLELSELISRLQGHRLRLLAQRGDLDRARLAADLDITRAEASALERAATRLGPLASFGAATTEGTITTSKAQMVADVVTPGRAAAAAADEARLLDLARTLGPVTLARELQRWAVETDAASGVDPSEQARARRHLTLTTRSDGAVAVDGLLDGEAAETVRTAIDAAVDERWRSEQRGDHPQVSGPQRRADALVAICTHYLMGSGVVDGPPRQKISVIVPLQVLEEGGGSAVTANGAVLSAAAARRLACDADICRGVITAPGSTILDLGRSQRLVSASQRRALVVRDGAAVPGVPRPAGMVPRPSSRGLGPWWPHRPDNIALLCTRHHHFVHEGGWHITRRADGSYTATSPDGRILTGDRPPPLHVSAA